MVLRIETRHTGPNYVFSKKKKKLDKVRIIFCNLVLSFAAIKMRLFINVPQLLDHCNVAVVNGTIRYREEKKLYRLNSLEKSYRKSTKRVI